MSPVRRGLSLIELLIVVTLIVTMMSMSLPMLSNANARARSELCQQNLVEISQTIASVTMEHGELPTLYTLQPTQDGLSLPELIESRAHTPQVVFCPSDETEQSHILGTSYQWASSFNGLGPGELGTMLGQPILADREAYHAGSALPISEVTVIEDEAGYRLSLPGEDTQDRRPTNNRPKLYLNKMPEHNPEHEPNVQGPPRHHPHDD